MSLGRLINDSSDASVILPTLSFPSGSFTARRQGYRRASKHSYAKCLLITNLRIYLIVYAQSYINLIVTCFLLPRLSCKTTGQWKIFCTLLEESRTAEQTSYTFRERPMRYRRNEDFFPLSNRGNRISLAFLPLMCWWHNQAHIFLLVSCQFLIISKSMSYTQVFYVMLACACSLYISHAHQISGDWLFY